MGTDSPTGGHGRRRGCGRAAAILALALATGGCGDSGHGAETDPEKGADAEILNEALIGLN